MEPADAIPHTGKPPELRAETLRKEYDGRVVLEDVDMEVGRGEFVAIVGGSGSGKTVLLHLLSALTPPTKGRAFAADHSREGAPLIDLNAATQEELENVRLHWGFVFQRNALFTGSVFDNVALLLREHSSLTEAQIDARVRQSLKDAALDVGDVIDKDRDELSGGMAKRVAIARAIAIDPAMVFYDEPTTGLDPVIGGHIHELIWNLHNRKTEAGVKRTSLVVTHDRDLLRRIQPRVVMLADGKVVFKGAYDQFAAQTSGPPFEYLRAMPVLHAKR